MEQWNKTGVMEQWNVGMMGFKKWERWNTVNLEWWNVGMMGPQNYGIILWLYNHHDVFICLQRYLSNLRPSVFSEEIPLTSVIHFQPCNGVDPIVRIPPAWFDRLVESYRSMNEILRTSQEQYSDDSSTLWECDGNNLFTPLNTSFPAQISKPYLNWSRKY